MASQYPPQKNTEYTFDAWLPSQANTKVFQVNPTLAAGDVKVVIDGGAPANIATLPTVDADFTKRVPTVLSASEMNGDIITVLFSDAAGDQWCDVGYQIDTTTGLFSALATAAAVAALSIPSAGTIADAVHDEVIEGTLTERQIIRILLAVLAGESTGGGTATVNFRDNADSKARVTATVDGSGNRTAITLDGT